MGERRLTPRQELFCREYCRDWNGARAAVAAGYAKSSAKERAYDLLTLDHVKEWIDRYKASITKTADLSVEEVAGYIKAVLRVDPNELVEQHVGSCRHCWGAHFKYQEKPSEFLARFQAYQKREAGPKATGEDFDPLGGDGYMRKKAPNPECPECEGVGIEFTVNKPSGSLTGDARKAYLGVKPGKNGPEILMYDKAKAAEQAMRYLGMNKEQVMISSAPSGLGTFYPEDTK